MLLVPPPGALAGQLQVSGREKFFATFFCLITQELAAGKSISVVSIGMVEQQRSGLSSKSNSGLSHLRLFGSGDRPPVTIKTCFPQIMSLYHDQLTWSPFESVNDPQACRPLPCSRSGRGPMKPVRSLDFPVRSYLCIGQQPRLN